MKQCNSCLQIMNIIIVRFGTASEMCSTLQGKMKKKFVFCEKNMDKKLATKCYEFILGIQKIFKKKKEFKWEVKTFNRTTKNRRCKKARICDSMNKLLHYFLFYNENSETMNYY